MEHQQIVCDHPFGIFNIELTNKCPMRCVMCPRTNNMTREQGFMQFALFQKIIDELVLINPDYVGHHPVWLHHFGESLMHRDFAKFIRYMKKKGVLAFLSINPVMLTEQVSDALLAAQPDLLYLSLDGHDDHSFHRIRGVKGIYELSVQRALRFLDHKKELHSRVKIVLSMIDFPMNTESIQKTEHFWRTREGIDNVLLKSFSTWDGNALDVRALLDEKDSMSTSGPHQPVTCNFPWEKVTILWDGIVVPCCYDYNKRLALGDVNKERLSEIWNNRPMRSLRREFIENRVENPLCRNCDKLRLPRHLWKW